MKAILVSGTPAAGKTTIARKLSAKLGFRCIDVNKVVKENRLSENYDRKRRCMVVDASRLNRVLIGMIKKSEKPLVIDSHLSHFLPPRYAYACIIAKADLKTLKKRLEKRKYPKSKVRENLDAEIFDVCLEEAKSAGHNIIVVDTSKKFSVINLAKSIRKLL